GITANIPPANADRVAVAPSVALSAARSRTPALPAVPSGAAAEAAHDSPVAAYSVGPASRRSLASDTQDELPNGDHTHRLHSVPDRDRSAAVLRVAVGPAVRSAVPRRGKSARSHRDRDCWPTASAAADCCEYVGPTLSLIPRHSDTDSASARRRPNCCCCSACPRRQTPGKPAGCSDRP